jgi:hypothetical protein
METIVPCVLPVMLEHVRGGAIGKVNAALTLYLTDLPDQLSVFVNCP